MTPLHAIGEAIRDALQAIPLGGVRGFILVLLGLLLAWVLKLPRSQTTNPDATEHRADLRWGAAAALVVQIVIYALL